MLWFYCILSCCVLGWTGRSGPVRVHLLCDLIYAAYIYCWLQPLIVSQHSLGNALPGFSWWQNSNWETVPLHEPSTCLSSLYWRLNLASPFFHSSSYELSSLAQQILTIILSKNLSCFCCLLYFSCFMCFLWMKWGWSILLKLGFIYHLIPK